MRPPAAACLPLFLIAFALPASPGAPGGEESAAGSAAPTAAGVSAPASAAGEAAGTGQAAPGEERISAEKLKSQLTFLASPELEGRESGARGSRAAARYLALQFEQAGLKPIGPAHILLDAAAPSYYQPFKVLKYRWSAERTSLQVRRRGSAESTRTYTLGTEFVPDQFIGNLEVTAPLVFAGYGITAPELGYDDYAGLDARGRAALVFDHEPQETRDDSRWGGHVLTLHSAIDVKARNAQKHGAAALLVMPEPVPQHKDLWDLWGDWYSEHITEPAQALEEDDIAIPVLYVRPRVGRDLLSAAGREPAALQKEIDSSGRPRSFAVPEVSLTVRLGLAESAVATTESIVGLVEGSDPALRDEVVIVSAHHDHDGAIGGEIFLGADDDGSGTVSVLEMARALAAAPRRPRRSILFAAWGAEEKGLLGSRYYVFRPLLPLAKTVAVLQLDMVGRDESPRDAQERVSFAGRDTRNDLNLMGTFNVPELRPLLGRLNAGIGLNLDYKFERDLEENAFTRSDHYPFALAGLPAFWFFTGFHPDYHTPADSAEKINYAKMEKIARLVYRTAWALADAGERPRVVAVPVPPPAPAERPASPLPAAR